jgi:UDP-4-amino-4,6-dideoxy-N-acetyl-beta-L-altrosamine N-acetyltransferase
VIDLVECAEEHRWLLYEWRNSPELSQYMFDLDPIPRDVHDEWYSGLLARRGRRGWVVTSDGSPVGACFLTGHSPTDRRASFGIYLADPATRGGGAGGAAQYLLCERAFSQEALHKLTCEVLGGNARAIAMYKGLGFVEEGVQRDQLMRDGAWVDVHLLALFEAAWDKLHQALADRLRERGLIA